MRKVLFWHASWLTGRSGICSRGYCDAGVPSWDSDDVVFLARVTVPLNCRVTFRFCVPSQPGLGFPFFVVAARIETVMPVTLISELNGFARTRLSGCGVAPG